MLRWTPQAHPVARPRSHPGHKVDRQGCPHLPLLHTLLLQWGRHQRVQLQRHQRQRLERQHCQLHLQLQLQLQQLEALLLLPGDGVCNHIWLSDSVHLDDQFICFVIISMT